MINRTWPYGTRKVVKILSYERTGTTCVIACEHQDDPHEATVIMCSANDVMALYHHPRAGQMRVM